jgi:hypothetical protein
LKLVILEAEINDSFLLSVIAGGWLSLSFLLWNKQIEDLFFCQLWLVVSHDQ